VLRVISTCIPSAFPYASSSSTTSGKQIRSEIPEKVWMIPQSGSSLARDSDAVLCVVTAPKIDAADSRARGTP
jgi:hypothetical protein